MPVAARGQKDCGLPYPLCIDSGPPPIAISGQFTMRYSLVSGIIVSAKRVAKPATSNGLTAPYGNRFRDCFARPCHFPETWRIKSGRSSGTSFTTPTLPYLFRTTTEPHLTSGYSCLLLLSHPTRSLQSPLTACKRSTTW